MSFWWKLQRRVKRITLLDQREGTSITSVPRQRNRHTADYIFWFMSVGITDSPLKDEICPRRAVSGAAIQTQLFGGAGNHQDGTAELSRHQDKEKSFPGDWWTSQTGLGTNVASRVTRAPRRDEAQLAGRRCISKPPGLELHWVAREISQISILNIAVSEILENIPIVSIRHFKSHNIRYY